MTVHLLFCLFCGINKGMNIFYFFMFLCVLILFSYSYKGLPNSFLSFQAFLCIASMHWCTSHPCYFVFFMLMIFVSRTNSVTFHYGETRWMDRLQNEEVIYVQFLCDVRAMKVKEVKMNWYFQVKNMYKVSFNLLLYAGTDVMFNAEQVLHTLMLDSGVI